VDNPPPSQSRGQRLPASEHSPATKYWRRAVPRGKAIARPSNTDAQEPYSREQLERMDARFVERLERAIARGKERPPCLTF
jgi:hypothetical protein